MWMINIIKIITGETAIKLLLIVVTVELNEHWKDAGDKYDN